ncbi:MAG: hypothetical protein ACOCU8_01720 [Patescibacteria group bacterium]
MSEEFKKEERELPQSFLAEFNADKLPEIMDLMAKMGFRFKRGTPDTVTGDSVTFEGERPDGTTVVITIDKGDRYQSPQELEDTE